MWVQMTLRHSKGVAARHGELAPRVSTHVPLSFLQGAVHEGQGGAVDGEVDTQAFGLAPQRLGVQAQLRQQAQAGKGRA